MLHDPATDTWPALVLPHCNNVSPCISDCMYVKHATRSVMLMASQ